jgi:hypothetical protein
MKLYLFLLIIFSSSFLSAMEREPVRAAVIAHLVDCYGNDDLQAVPAPENAYGVMDQWCTGQQTSARVRLWLASKDPVEARTVEHMSLVDLLHIAGNCSSPVPVSIAAELNNERRVIWEHAASRIAQAQKARQPREVVLVMGDDQPAGGERDEEESGCCSCGSFKEFLACVKKKDQ